MKSVDNFSETNKSSQVGESFYFKAEENNKFVNENYVFHFEENKAGQDYNATGKEYNHKADISGNEHHENLDTKQLEISTEAASTTASSAVSGAVATAGTVVTTAVVVVVGGGMVVMGQSYEKPSIVEFNELYSELNTIRFTLSIGNNQEKIDAGEENDETDITIELTCESYEDFKEVREVKNFGKIESEFNDLQYQTEYTINVIQNTFLDLETAPLIEPIKITTGDPLPTEKSEIKIEKGTDSFGNIIFYATVSYVDAMSGLSDFSLKAVEGDFDENDLSSVNWVDSASLSRDFNGNRELLSWSSLDVSKAYNIVLTAMKDPENKNNKRSLKAGSASEVVLYKETIDLATITTTIDNPIKFNLEKVVDPLGNIQYYARLDYMGLPTGYEGYDLCVYPGQLPEDTENLDWMGRSYYEVLDKERRVLDSWTVENPNGLYSVCLVGYQEDETGRTKEIIIVSQEIDFSQLPSSNLNETNLYVERERYSDGTVKYKAMYNYIEDNASYYSNFRLLITNVGETYPYVVNTTFNNFGDTITFTIDDSRYSHYQSFNVKVLCTTTNPVDIEEYNKNPTGSMATDKVEDYPIFEKEIDFNYIPEHYIELDPIVNGLLFYFKNTFFGNEYLFIDFDYKDTHSYWNDFQIRFENGSDVKGGSLAQSPYGKWWINPDEFTGEDIESLIGSTWNYTILCISSQPSGTRRTRAGSADPIPVYTGSVAFDSGIDFERVNGCVSIKKTEEAGSTAVIYKYSVEEMYIDSNLLNNYSEYRIDFTPVNGDGNIVGETIHKTITSLYNQEITEISDFNARYLVETYGVSIDDGSTEYFFSETIDFANL